jgi:hypothetical protein
MHLMYTVDDQGNRVYTLKVHISFRWWRLIVDLINCVYQKVTDAGKVTKSAHPGAPLFGLVSVYCVLELLILGA